MYSFIGGLGGFRGCRPLLYFPASRRDVTSTGSFMSCQLGVHSKGSQATWWVMGACAHLRTGRKLREEQNQALLPQPPQLINRLVSCCLRATGFWGPAVGERAPVRSQGGPGVGHSTGPGSGLVVGQGAGQGSVWG